MAIGISLTVLPENQEVATRVVEALSRVAVGLGFDGITVSISINNFEDEYEEKEE